MDTCSRKSEGYHFHFIDSSYMRCIHCVQTMKSWARIYDEIGTFNICPFYIVHMPQEI